MGRSRGEAEEREGRASERERGLERERGVSVLGKESSPPGRGFAVKSKGVSAPPLLISFFFLKCLLIQLKLLAQS